jgi:hypothetical protein
VSYIAGTRSPFPYTFKIGSVGLMLGSAQPTGRGGAPGPMLVSSKTQDISQVAPPGFEYGGMSPMSDREEPYESLALGMGMRLQEQWQDGHYASAQCVDLSVWPWCKGPEVTLFTPASHDATAIAATYFELGGVLYLAQGRYVNRRDGDGAWTQVLDAGAGAQIVDVKVFTSNFDGVQRAFLALGGGVPARYSSNGTTWTAMATFGANAFAVIGREFWWADDVNRLRKCDTNADPTNEANYTNLIFRAGDKSSPVTSLAVTAAGTLLILKTDGLYTLDGAGDDHSLFPFLKFAADGNNGRWWGQFENDIFASYGTELLKIDPGLTMSEVGPEKLINNDSPVRGRVTAFSAVGTLFAYASIWNPDTLTSYLVKFGAWISEGMGQQQNPWLRVVARQLEPVHVDAWHGSVSVPFTNRAMQRLFVSSIGGPTNHTRTYMAFSDGSVGWVVNPCVPNPAACSAYRFHVGDSWVDLPLWHAGYHASRKSVRHAAVTGVLDAQNYVTLEYKLDPSAGSFTALGNTFDSSVYEIAAFPTSAVAVLAAFRVHLVNTVNTKSPLVSAFAIGHALRPERFMQIQVEVLCSDGLVRLDGVPLRIGRDEIKRVVEAAVDTPGAVTCTLPDETVLDLSFTDYAVSQSFDEVGRQWRGSLAVKAVQWIGSP